MPFDEQEIDERLKRLEETSSESAAPPNIAISPSGEILNPLTSFRVSGVAAGKESPPEWIRQFTKVGFGDMLVVAQASCFVEGGPGATQVEFFIESEELGVVSSNVTGFFFNQNLVHATVPMLGAKTNKPPGTYTARLRVRTLGVVTVKGDAQDFGSFMFIDFPF